MAVKADVRVSVEEKEASKKRFIAEKNRILTSLDRLQREVNNVRGWWKGAGGAAFVERFSRVKAEITADIESRVADYCTLMDATVESILETDRQLAQQVGLASINNAFSSHNYIQQQFRSQFDNLDKSAPLPAANDTTDTGILENIKNEWQKFGEAPGAGSFFTALGETLKHALTEPFTQDKTNIPNPAHLVEGVIDGTEGIFATAGGVLDYAQGAYITGMSHVPFINKLLPQSVKEWGQQRFAAGNEAISDFVSIGTTYDWIELETYFLMMPLSPLYRQGQAAYSAITGQEFHTFPVILERMGAGVKEQVVGIYEERGPVNGSLYCLGEVVPMVLGTKGMGVLKGGKVVAGAADAIKEGEIVAGAAEAARVIKEGEIIAGSAKAATEATIAVETASLARLEKFQAFLEGAFKRQPPKLAAPEVDIGALETKMTQAEVRTAEGAGAQTVQEVSQAVRSTSIPQAKIDEILNTVKGKRPDPTSYLSDKYIAEHLDEFSNGVTRIMSEAPTGSIGPKSGTFVMPSSVADDLIAQAGGDVTKLEQLLGLPEGYLGSNPIRVDISTPTGLRMPSGNEFGANSQWIPGGYTSGGIPEAIIDQVPPTGYIVKTILN